MYLLALVPSPQDDYSLHFGLGERVSEKRCIEFGFSQGR